MTQPQPAEPASPDALRELLAPSRPRAVALTAVTAVPDDRPQGMLLRQGMYVPARDWEDLRPEDQLCVRAFAIDAQSRDRKLFSHHTAAALWGLPIVGRWPVLVEHTTRSGTKGRSPGTKRRRAAALPDAALHRGVLLTSVARTVVDLARELRLEGALAAADHALHHRMCTRADLLAELSALKRGARGKRVADVVIQLADGLSESPGESLSRARMFQLSLPRPELQKNLYDGRGLIGRVDFWWEDLALIGEFDGRTKYAVNDQQPASKAAGILWREKRRQDRLCEDGNRRMARWVWDDALSMETFRGVMLSAGVCPTVADTWEIAPCALAERPT